MFHMHIGFIFATLFLLKMLKRNHNEFYILILSNQVFYCVFGIIASEDVLLLILVKALSAESGIYISLSLFLSTHSGADLEFCSKPKCQHQR